MMLYGFAPYDGEWWHFSFGDKEWAFYYKKEATLFEQKSENFVIQSLKKQSRFVGSKYISYRYTIIRPGGNNTALVLGIERNFNKRKQINDQIMKKYSKVEQVGFVNPNPTEPELLMAGGEFCGNATRSAAWYILDGKPGEIFIKVSGAGTKLRAGVDEKGNAWAQMPIYANPSKITSLGNGSAIIPMEGITYVVIENIYSRASTDKLKQITMQLLRDLGLDKSVPAAGVVFSNKSRSGVKIRPVVFVRDINTLFYESACGSGATAVGLLEALKKGGSVNLPVVQPTGMLINVRVSFNGTEFEQAIISGLVTVLKVM